jgi:hypothetical protein
MAVRHIAKFIFIVISPSEFVKQGLVTIKLSGKKLYYLFVKSDTNRLVWGALKSCWAGNEKVSQPVKIEV